MRAAELCSMAFFLSLLLATSVSAKEPPEETVVGPRPFADVTPFNHVRSCTGQTSSGISLREMLGFERGEMFARLGGAAALPAIVADANASDPCAIYVLLDYYEAGTLPKPRGAPSEQAMLRSLARFKDDFAPIAWLDANAVAGGAVPLPRDAPTIRRREMFGDRAPTMQERRGDYQAVRLRQLAAAGHRQSLQYWARRDIFVDQRDRMRVYHWLIGYGENSHRLMLSNLYWAGECEPGLFGRCGLNRDFEKADSILAPLLDGNDNEAFSQHVKNLMAIGPGARGYERLLSELLEMDRRGVRTAKARISELYQTAEPPFRDLVLAYCWAVRGTLMDGAVPVPNDAAAILGANKVRQIYPELAGVQVRATTQTGLNCSAELAPLGLPYQPPSREERDARAMLDGIVGISRALGQQLVRTSEEGGVRICNNSSSHKQVLMVRHSDSTVIGPRLLPRATCYSLPNQLISTIDRNSGYIVRLDELNRTISRAQENSFIFERTENIALPILCAVPRNSLGYFYEAAISVAQNRDRCIAARGVVLSPLFIPFSSNVILTINIS